MNPASTVPAPRLAVPLALAAVYVIWGSTYLAIRLALEGGWPPFMMGGLRFLIAGGLLFAVLRLRGEPVPTLRQWGNGAAMGVLLLLCGNGLVNFAEQSVSSGIAAVALASVPMWFGIFAALRGERPSTLEWGGIGVGFLGVVWLNAGAMNGASITGLLALLVAAISWSFGSIWSRGRDLPSPFMTSSVQMLCGGAAMVLVSLCLGERLAQSPSVLGWLAWGYLIVFGSWLGFSAYIWLLQHVRPALSGSHAYVNPVIAVLLGAMFAGERFSTSELAAMGVIVIGVIVISLGRMRHA